MSLFRRDSPLLDFSIAIVLGIILFYFIAGCSSASQREDSSVFPRAPVAQAYQLPIHSSTRVIQGYGGTFSHTGPLTYSIDFAVPVSTPVYASRGGVVVSLEESRGPQVNVPLARRVANEVRILHDDGTISVYGHLDFHGVLVSVGDSVSVGTEIARSGNTGFSTEPHLHFHVERNGRSIPVAFAGLPAPGFPRVGGVLRASR